MLTLRQLRFNVASQFQWIGLFLLTGILTFIVVASANHKAFKSFQVHRIKNKIIKAAPTEGSVFNIIDELDDQQVDNDSSVIVNREFFNYLSSNMRDAPYPGVLDFTTYTALRLEIQPLKDVEPLRPEFGPVYNDVTAFEYPINIPPCQNNTENTTTNSVFLAIYSAPAYFQKRNSIRQTWLQHFTNNKLINLLGYAFILAETKDRNIQKKIDEENEINKDIVQMSIMDDYYNLTLKTVGLINWIDKYCPHTDFAMKVDDDMYVNVRSLKTIVNKLGKELNVYGSRIGTNPLRSGKWWVSYQDWPWSRYPAYPTGNAVLIRGAAVRPLLAAAQTTPFIPFEDTYLHGLCTEKAGVGVRFSNRAFVAKTPTSLEDPCVVRPLITWVTSSRITMEKSHRATEDYFKNVTTCIIKGQAVDPWDIPPVVFSK